jgi:hypothetical protein
MTRFLVVALLAVLLPSCGLRPGSGATWQEPVIAVSQLAAPCFDNPVAFGSSLADRPDLQAQILAELDRIVAGHLPGVRFYIVAYPVLIPGTNTTAMSYRDPSSGLVVLSWRLYPGTGSLELEDPNWEISHMISGTYDDGTPVR